MAPEVTMTTSTPRSRSALASPASVATRASVSSARRRDPILMMTRSAVLRSARVFMSPSFARSLRLVRVELGLLVRGPGDVERADQGGDVGRGRAGQLRFHLLDEEPLRQPPGQLARRGQRALERVLQRLAAR